MFLAACCIAIFIHVDLPVEYDVASMDVTHDPTKMEEFNPKYGLQDTRIEPWDHASCIKGEAEFWKSFLDFPSMAIVTASKKKA